MEKAVLLQIEQLHCLASMSLGLRTSNLTLPQWDRQKV
jgi:hypothetical protein